MITIPNDSNSTHYDMSVVIDDVVCLMEFRWNNREQAWYCFLSNDTGKAQFKVTIGSPISAIQAGLTGALIAIDLSGKGIDAGEKDLGDRVILTYASDAELKLVGLR